MKGDESEVHYKLGMVSRWLYHWNTILNSGSITQSKESKVLPVIQYIYKASFTQIMNSCESMIDA